MRLFLIAVLLAAVQWASIKPAHARPRRRPSPAQAPSPVHDVPWTTAEDERTSSSEEENDVGVGVSRRAAEAVARLEDTESPELQTYLERYVEVREEEGGVSAYQGKYQKALDAEDFLAATEQHALRDQQRARTTRIRRLRWVTMLFGGAGGLTLVVSPFLDFHNGGKATMPTAVTGAVAAAVGFSTAIALMPLDESVITAPDARRLADEHNAELRRKLGLSKDTVDAALRAEREEREKPEERASTKHWYQRMSLVPALRARGVGLCLTGAL